MSNSVIGTLYCRRCLQIPTKIGDKLQSDNSKSPSRPILGYMQVIVEGNTLLVHSCRWVLFESQVSSR